MYEYIHKNLKEGIAMKGLITDGKGNLRLVEDVPMPKVSDYSAIVRTIACGICNGTDVKLVQGHLRGFSNYPAILGHESVGEVIEVGNKVRNFKVEDLVLRSCLPDHFPPYYSLWGSFGEYGRVVDCRAMTLDGINNDGEAVSQQTIPRGIDPCDGVMLITLKEVYSALKRLVLYPGASVGIVGGGPVGLAMVKCCKLQGAGFVAIADHHNERLAKAVKLGADLAVNSCEEDFEAMVKKYCLKLDFVIDAVGSCDVVSMALRLVRPDGVIGMYGIGMEDNRPVVWSGGPYNWKLYSVQWPVACIEASVHDAVVGHILNGDIDLKDFVTHVLPVEQYQEGFDLIQNRKALKVSLVFNRQAVK
jgi:threonine dehydrogenase-like Zn-dependent dehydrogenase